MIHRFDNHHLSFNLPYMLNEFILGVLTNMFVVVVVVHPSPIHMKSILVMLIYIYICWYVCVYSVDVMLGATCNIVIMVPRIGCIHAAQV